MPESNKIHKTLNMIDVEASNTAEPNLEQQEKYWKYWQCCCENSQWSCMRAECILQFLRGLDLDNAKILDIGCGTGWFASKMVQFGQVTGIDLNKEAMFQANTRYPNINFVGGDLFDYPLTASSFNVIVAQQVIAHVENPMAFVDRVASLLSPGGYLIVTTNNKFVMDRLGTQHWGSHRSAGHIEKWLTVKGLRNLISRYFEVLEVRTLLPMGNGGLLRIVNSEKLNCLVKALVPAKSLRRFKENWGLGYYILIFGRKYIESESRNAPNYTH